MDPFDVFDAGRMTIATDPSGAHFGVWQANQHIGAQLANDPGTMNWNECQTRDAAAAARVLRGRVRGRGEGVPGCRGHAAVQRHPRRRPRRRRDLRDQRAHGRHAAELVDDLRGRRPRRRPLRRRRSSAGRCWRRGWTCPRSAASRCSRIRPAPSSRSCSRRPRLIAATPRRPAALAALAGAASAAAPVHVIHGDSSAGGIRIARSTPADVKKLFGAPSTCAVTSARSCGQSWNGAHLTVTFFTFEDKPCARGVALIVTVTGRTAWRTAVGLRVGDSAARLRSLYPKARLRTGFAGRQRLLARDPAGLRRGRRRRLSGPARADEGRPRGRARRPQLRLRLVGLQGATLAQGYLISKPVSAADSAPLLVRVAAA